MMVSLLNHFRPRPYRATSILKSLGSELVKTRAMMNQSTIRVRACLAVVQDGKILLVPHFNTDKGPVQWNIPGGRVQFAESIRQTAIRELQEETGISARIVRLLDVSEVLLPERPWHSITITFLGETIGGELQAESLHPYGHKMPRWFTLETLRGLCYHPKDTIERSLREYHHEEGKTQSQ